MFKQQWEGKREELQVRIRKSLRQHTQSQYRHQLLISTFGYDPLTPHTYTIPKMVELLSEYISNERGQIETLLNQFAIGFRQFINDPSTIQTQVLGIFKRLYYSVEREPSSVCCKLQEKILSIMALFCICNHIITPESVTQFEIVEFLIEVMKKENQPTKAVLYFLNEISENPEIKGLLLKRRELMKLVENVTDSVAGDMEGKNTLPLIKLLLSWWGDIDLSTYNIETITTIDSLYKLSQQVISNYFVFLYTLDHQINEVNILNALKITHGLLDLYSQDMLENPTYKFYPNQFACLLGNQNIVEGKEYVIRIMAILVRQSKTFCQELVENTDYAQEVVRKAGTRNRKTAIVTIYNLLVNVGPLDAILPAMKSLVNELLINDFLKNDEREDILESMCVWMFHRNKKKLRPCDYYLIDSLSELKEPINIDKEIVFWRGIRRIGYKKGYPEYLTEMEMEGQQ